MYNYSKKHELIINIIIPIIIFIYTYYLHAVFLNMCTPLSGAAADSGKLTQGTCHEEAGE